MPLFISAIWEPVFHHTHEQSLQCFGILLMVAWSWFAWRLSDADRRSAERIVFSVFLALACTIALFPYLLWPDVPSLPAYRGVVRWRAWTMDPNNTGVVMALATVTALRLREEAPRKFSRLLLALAVLCACQLARSFSRIGMLTAVLALFTWLAPRWQALEKRHKQHLLLAFLVLVLAIPLVAPVLRSTDILLLRRALSFSNTMDLSWANRLYVLPGTIQAMLDKPLLGWGWGHVLQAHRMIYCPTFLGDSTAILLNDYAHLGASYGTPLLVMVTFLIGFCLVYGKSPYAKMTVVCLSAAMFFQGVIRIPLTLTPLCISMGILLGEHPPWKRENWRHASVPTCPALCLLAFLAAWCAGPLLMTDKRIRVRDDRVSISPSGQPPLTIIFVTDGELSSYGPEARAVASLGVRAIIAATAAVPEIEKAYGTNAWFVVQSPGKRHISPDAVNASTGRQRGVRAVHMVFGLSGKDTTPHPDKPYPTQAVIITLYLCALAMVLGECLNSLLRGLAVAGALLAVSLLWREFHPISHASGIENRQVAEWARQMRNISMPEKVYRDYVLSPDIAPDFSLCRRREVWHTFYQSTRGQNPSEMLERVLEAIDVQIMICPGKSPEIRTFEEIWRTRKCSLAERWYVLVAVLRTLNVPARIRSGRVEMWMDDNWHMLSP